MSSDPDQPPNSALTGFVWTVYDDMDAIVHMRHSLFRRPEEAAADDPRTSLGEFTAWLADAWPTVLGTREDVIREVMALPLSQLGAAGLTGVELETKLLIWRRARKILDEALREAGVELDETAPSGQPPAGTIPEPKLTRFMRFRRTKQIFKWTSRTLGHADTALGSLVKLVNLAERLQELKETVEKVTGELAEDLDEQPPHR